jgi:1-acyl-sn-glycerol-3-phosphate acyltransferase
MEPVVDREAEQSSGQLLSQPGRFDAFGFDPDYYDRGMRLAGAYFKWLRVEVDGLENVPAVGPALLVGNHAGHRCHDALSLQYAIRHLHPGKRAVRPLIDRNIGKVPIWGTFATEYAGSVIGHPRNADYLFESGQLAVSYPEGTHAVIKRFRDRNRLCPPDQWGSGFVLTALRNEVPVVPVVTHGFEACIPTLWRSKRLGRFWGTRRGLFPVSPQGLVTGTLPILTVAIPFPVRCTIAVLPPIDLRDLAPPGGVRTEADSRRIALQVREAIQRRLEAIVAKRRILPRRRG